MTNQEQLQHLLCTRFCADIKTRARPDGSIQIATPFVGKDGDTYNIYIRRNDDSSYRITDKGSTIMRLSYETDLKTLKGARSEILSQILHESGMEFDNGEVYTQTHYDNIPNAIFGMGQALTRLSDIGLWTKSRIKSTFYDDLLNGLNKVVRQQAPICRDYYLPDYDEEKLFPIDYWIAADNTPLAVFGVPDSAKARLATIILLKFHEWKIPYGTLVVLNGTENIGNSDLGRLMDAAGDLISEPGNIKILERKIQTKIPNLIH